MRKKSKVSIRLAVLGLAAVLCSGTAFAEVMLRFQDADGNALSGCGGSVYTTEWELIQKFDAAVGGEHMIDASVGDKLVFVVSDPQHGKSIIEQVVPGSGLVVVRLLGAPPNDDCANAERLTLPANAVGSTDGAQDDPAVSGTTCGTSISSRSAGIWYTVTGTGTTLTASTAGSDFDTKLSIFCADCVEPTCVGGDDDGGPSVQSEVSWCSEAGAEYLIFVHGFLANTGSVALSVVDTGLTCAPEVSCLPPTPTGACCSCLAPGFNCTVETAEDCAAFGGEYQGDDAPCFGPGVTTGDTVTPVVAIPDNDAAGVDSALVVPDNIIIGDVDVSVTIEHTFIGDLVITLTHPSGAPSVVLWDRACSFENDLSVLFDDDGADLACGEPTAGTFNPLSADGVELSNFNGLMSGGAWTLNVSDNAGLDLGTLVEWSIVLTTQGEALCPDTSGGTTSCDEDEDEDGDADSLDLSIETVDPASAPGQAVSMTQSGNTGAAAPVETDSLSVEPVDAEQEEEATSLKPGRSRELRRRPSVRRR